MRRTGTMFYSALLLTGANLALRMVSMGFQVYLSGQIGAAGIGLLQLVLSVSMLAMTAGMGGIRTSAMYLTAEEIGKNRRHGVRHVLSACFLYSFLFSTAVALLVYVGAPLVAEHWIGDIRTLEPPSRRNLVVIFVGRTPAKAPQGGGSGSSGQAAP